MAEDLEIPDSSFKQSDTDALRFAWIEPSAAQPNVQNWRIHPPSQTRALNKLIFQKDGVGWAGVVLVNDRRVEDGWSAEEAVPTLIDGHDRQQIALQHEQQMPALIGQWSPAQEKLILATFDPIGALAQADNNAWKALLSELESEDQDIALLLDQLAEKAGVLDAVDFGELPDVDNDKADAGMQDVLFKVRVLDPDCYEDLVQQVTELIEVNGYAAKVEK